MSEPQSPSRFCRTPEDFEEVAAEWLRFWGYVDARRTRSGPDGGADVVATGAVAQVKAWMTPIGSPHVQQLKDVAYDGAIDRCRLRPGSEPVWRGGLREVF